MVQTEKTITQEGLDNSAAKLISPGTTIITARGTVGKIALAGMPMTINQSCYGLRSKTEAAGFFTYFQTRELIAELKQHAHGSVFDTITRDTLVGLWAVVPLGELVAAFESRVGPALIKIRVALNNSRILSRLRDELLPRLISGDLTPGQP